MKQKLPRPKRTKKGSGAGARLDLTIDYYRAADGVGADWGTVFGKTEHGPWELKFATPGELDSAINEIRNKLRQVATEAREEDERSSEGRTVWLKAIGAQGYPVRENWEGTKASEIQVDFPFRPKSVKPRDLLVIYAAGAYKLIGVVEVTDDPYEDRGDAERWRYRLYATVLAAVPKSQGQPLDLLAGERVIGKSIRQKSHIKLSDGEAAAALKAFGVDAA